MLLFPLPSPCLLVTCLSLSLPVLPSFSLKPSRPPPGSYMLRLCRIAPGLSFCLLPRSVPSLLWGAGVARTDTQILASCPCFPRTSAPYPYPHLPDSSSKLSSSKIPDLPSALACQPERCLQCFCVLPCLSGPVDFAASVLLESAACSPCPVAMLCPMGLPSTFSALVLSMPSSWNPSASPSPPSSCTPCAGKLRLSLHLVPAMNMLAHRLWASPS